jgi:hypothetical protein
VPILLIAALLFVSVGTFIGSALLERHLHPLPDIGNDPPGPCCDGDITVVFVLLLFPFSALAAFIHIFATFVRLCASPTISREPAAEQQGE